MVDKHVVQGMGNFVGFVPLNVMCSTREEDIPAKDPPNLTTLLRLGATFVTRSCTDCCQRYRSREPNKAVDAEIFKGKVIIALGLTEKRRGCVPRLVQHCQSYLLLLLQGHRKRYQNGWSNSRW